MGEAGSLKKDDAKLTAIAKDLVKSVCSHVETASLEALDEIVKNTSTIPALKESSDAKFNTLTQSIGDLKQSVENLNSNTLLQTKLQRIEWAYAHADLESFTYYQVQSGYSNASSYTSTAFVKQILLSFRKNMGNYINNRSLDNVYGSYNRDAERIKEGEKKFRNQLVAQIETLLGKKPRIDAGTNGENYALYYS
eukprot:7087985-Ditylum_brightwellii.AAC.1